jgi:predicted dehydrogenase/nucleoside-diphosphate-sugar epimerase
MGRHHADAILRTSDNLVTLAGFVDPDEKAAEEAATARGVTAFSDLARALSELRPDVVHVCSPPQFHGPIALECLEAGAHLYVEKPFTLTLSEAREVLDRAAASGLRVAAGHQLLQDPATHAGEALLGSIGDLRHVESYFAFKPRREVSGRRPRTPVEQLLDILPHPTYVLAHFLEAATGKAPAVRWLEATEEGSANVAVEAGSATGSLVVTLEGRPVNSYLRLVGTRGTVHLDYVRGVVMPKLWLGSGLDKVVEPYYEALRLSWGSTRSLAARVLRRERSYPGLRPMFEAHYASIRGAGSPPVSRENILFSVDLVERVANRIEERTKPYERPTREPTIVVTGGTGFLGRQVVSALLETGEVPLVLGRRLPPGSERLEGTHYAACDLAEPESIRIPSSVHSIVHCAAETAGSWDAHQRNSVDGTRYLLEAGGAAGVERFLHVSSLGVVSLNARAPISESAPVEADSKARGPYVWGKLESERLVAELGAQRGMKVSIIRPGPLVDPAEGPPPGRLGRAVGPMFVAIGPRGGQVPTTDVEMAGRLLARAAAGEIELPEVLHLLDPVPRTRKQLIAEERGRRKGVRVIWMPWLGIRFLSGVAWALQKVLRPSRPAIKVSSAFAAPRYDTTTVASVLRAAELERSPS